MVHSEPSDVDRDEIEAEGLLGDGDKEFDPLRLNDHKSERKSVDHLTIHQRHSVSSRSSYSANIGENYIIPDHAGRNELIQAQLEDDMQSFRTA